MSAPNDVFITNGSSIPSFSNTLPSAVQGNITTVGTISSGTWAGTTITVNHGGTGQTTLTNHGVLIGAGTTAITQLASASTGTVLIGNTGADPSFSATPTVTSITISNAPVSGTDGTNKTYVDAIAAGFEFKAAVYAASTASLNATYLNGIAGVGATLINAGTLVAFSIDGTSPPITSRILVKDQGSTFQNGIYTLTTVGSGAVAWVLTRATDYDQTSEIQSGDLVPVVNGTVNGDTTWLETATVSSIGTDPITFVRFTSQPITTTQYAVLVGGANNTVASVGPGSAGQILQSGGNAANPAYSTPTYPSTSGSSGKILISDGTNNVYSTPTYPNAASTALKHIKSDGTNFVTTTVTYPDASVTAGKVIISDGTNYIASTPTFPNASATSGKFIRSDGTNWIASTPTLPTSAGTSGKVLQSDGTNYVESTPTYPSTSGTSGKVLISDGTNNVYSTPTFPNASATSGKFIRSDGTNWIASTPTLPTSAGTSGKVLQSDGTNYVESTPTYPSTSGSSGKILISDGTNNVYSTPTYPNASASSGKIIISDGTNFIASTPTYPNSAGTSGNLLKSDGTNFVSSTAKSSGASLVWLSSQSASSSASLAFTSLISATYTTYCLIWSNVVPATTSTTLTLQVSSNNGSTYIATNYQSGINGYAYNSATGVNNQSTTYIVLNGSTVNTANDGSSGTLWMHGVGTKLFNTNSHGYTTDTVPEAVINYGAGYNTSTAVNAFQVLFSSGNITSGTFTFYGLLE